MAQSSLTFNDYSDNRGYANNACSLFFISCLINYKYSKNLKEKSFEEYWITKFLDDSYNYIYPEDAIDEMYIKLRDEYCNCESTEIAYFLSIGIGILEHFMEELK